MEYTPETDPAVIIAEDQALWAAFDEAKTTELADILGQLETGQDEPINVENLRHAVRTEVETRFFETHPSSYDASSALDVSTSTIDAGEGGGSGS